MTKTLDAPYDSVFQPEEKWEVSPVDGQPEKCLLLCSVWVRFWKKIVLKSTIETKVIEVVTADHNLWLKNLFEKKIIAESISQNKPGVNGVDMTHRIERSLNMHTEELKDEARLGHKNNAEKGVKAQSNRDDKESYVNNLLSMITFFICFILVMIMMILVGNFMKFKSICGSRMAILEDRYHEQQEIIYEVSNIIKNLQK